MPRIELIPVDLDEGESSLTIDVCKADAEHFVEGEEWDWENGEQSKCTIGSTDVDHPPYEDDEYLCAVCQSPLTNED